MDLIKVKRKLSLEDAAAFHGHKGPWLILGYKAGERAIAVLKPADEKDLKCLIKCPMELPYTCVIDGVQVSSKCTLGKLNLIVKESNIIELIFENRSNGSKLSLRPKRKVIKALLKGGREIIASLEEANPCELFEEERG
ncbi:MAG: formylmethanofuran dehydrogenase [Thermofilum sp. ex4484_15]|nr:MAG: formylmethanofuran dehydrogenase [Thermofilum sp. ex4484_15]